MNTTMYLKFNGSQIVRNEEPKKVEEMNEKSLKDFKSWGFTFFGGLIGVLILAIGDLTHQQWIAVIGTLIALVFFFRGYILTILKFFNLPVGMGMIKMVPLGECLPDKEYSKFIVSGILVGLIGGIAGFLDFFVHEKWLWFIAWPMVVIGWGTISFGIYLYLKERNGNK